MIVGTAGHIDHGKSALVHALTGTDPDRLPEERARGITIDLGFAYRRPKTPDEPVLGFVDVPGHERLVHTMLAGAGGIDFVLLVVAADDGPMPQTIEHLQILDLLGLDRGVVALSKSDLVPPERLAAVAAEIKSMLAGTGLIGAEIVPVSALTGTGVAELETHLLLAAMEPMLRPAGRAFRLAVDRSFTVAGAGVVVTGTVLGGRVQAGDRLLVSPQRLEVRVRGLHAQNRAAESGAVGQRCAVNLAAPQLHKDDIRRGDWLIAPELHAPTDRLDVALHLLPAERRPLQHWTPVHLHLAAAHVPARVALLEADLLAPGGTAMARLVLDRPIGAWWGDRVVLRDQSAQRTIGGGPVIDPWPPVRGRRRPGRLATLAALASPDPAAALRALADLPPGAIDLPRFARARCLDATAAAALWSSAELSVAGDFGFAVARRQTLGEAAVEALRRHHTAAPDSPGLERDRLRLALPERLPTPAFAALLEDWLAARRLESDGTRLRLPGHAMRLTAADQALWSRIVPLLHERRFDPPKARELAAAVGAQEDAVRGLLRRLAKMGRLVQVVPDQFFPRTAMAALAAIVGGLAEDGEVTAAAFRDRIGTGRKAAIQILEFFDRAGVTSRRGDLRRVQRDKLGLFGRAE